LQSIAIFPERNLVAIRSQPHIFAAQWKNASALHPISKFEQTSTPLINCHSNLWLYSHTSVRATTHNPLGSASRIDTFCTRRHSLSHNSKQLKKPLPKDHDTETQRHKPGTNKKSPGNLPGYFGRLATGELPPERPETFWSAASGGMAELVHPVAGQEPGPD
jgi:hypothetical protein